MLAVADPKVRREWVFAEDVARGILTLSTRSRLRGDGWKWRGALDQRWVRECANVLLLDERGVLRRESTRLSPAVQRARVRSEHDAVAGMGAACGLWELAGRWCVAAEAERAAIAIVHPQGYIGINPTIESMISFLAERGHDVHLISLYRPGR